MLFEGNTTELLHVCAKPRFRGLRQAKTCLKNPQSKQWQGNKCAYFVKLTLLAKKCLKVVRLVVDRIQENHRIRILIFSKQDSLSDMKNQ